MANRVGFSRLIKHWNTALHSVLEIRKLKYGCRLRSFILLGSCITVRIYVSFFDTSKNVLLGLCENLYLQMFKVITDIDHFEMWLLPEKTWLRKLLLLLFLSSKENTSYDKKKKINFGWKNVHKSRVDPWQNWLRLRRMLPLYLRNGSTKFQIWCLFLVR